MADSPWYGCPSVPYFEMDGSLAGMLVLLARYGLVWALLWYCITGLAELGLMYRLPASSKKHERSALFFAHEVVGMIKSSVVSGLANYALISTWNQSIPQLYAGDSTVYIAGVLFTSFELADLVLGACHQLHDATMLVHHTVHVMLGCIIIFNCGPHMTAAILMAQETSTPFLCVFVLSRNRTPKGHWLPTLSFNAFAICFVLWRIVGCTFGTLDYLLRYNSLLLSPSNAKVWQPWQLHLLAAGLVLGLVLQWSWGLKNFVAVISKLLNPKSDDVQKTF